MFLQTVEILTIVRWCVCCYFTKLSFPSAGLENSCKPHKCTLNETGDTSTDPRITQIIKPQIFSPSAAHDACLSLCFTRSVSLRLCLSVSPGQTGLADDLLPGFNVEIVPGMSLQMHQSLFSPHFLFSNTLIPLWCHFLLITVTTPPMDRCNRCENIWMTASLIKSGRNRRQVYLISGVVGFDSKHRKSIISVES